MSHQVKLGRKMNITDLQELKGDLRRESDPASGAAVRIRAGTEEGKRALVDLEAENPPVARSVIFEGVVEV